MDTGFEPIDLDVDLSQVDTSFPVIDKGVYDFTITKIAKEENKEKKGYNLVVTLTNIDAVPKLNGDGETYDPGKVSLRKYFPLQKKEGGSDKFDYRVGLAGLLDAVLGTTQGDRPKFSSGLIINKPVRASIAVTENKDAGDGSFQNEIKRLTHPE